MLIKETLAAQLLNMFSDLSKRTENQAESNQHLANALADIIDMYVKSATVNFTAPVTTTGTATTQTGIVTGTGTLS